MVWFGYASVNVYIGLFYALHGVVLLLWRWFIVDF